MKEHKYSRISAFSTDHDSEAAVGLLKSPRTAQTLLKSQWPRLLLSFIAGIVCAIIASKIHNKKSYSEVDMLRTAGSIVTPFEYNDTFPGPPTMASEEAWLDLLPNGIGFVQHEDLNDGIVDISVFHQLHCLMALRHAIYDSWNEEPHSHMTPHHTKHCLEYIRQSIMCNVDTNIEVRQTFENGEKFTPGWGLKRCRDYQKVKEFAESWRVWDGKITKTRQEITDPDVLKGRIIQY